MARIGLTGADGVLGLRLTDVIEADGHSVAAFTADVRDLAAVRAWAAGCDRLIHAAAIVPTQAVAEAPGEAISVNVGGAANVAKAAAEGGLPLTYVSTSHVYAAKPGLLAESDPTAPSGFYGLTKLQAEAVVRLLAPDSLIVRVFSFFDARQKPPFLVPSLHARIAAAGHGETLELMGASHVRDIIDGTTVARICWALASAGEGGVVNCGAGSGMTVLEIARAAAAALGRSDIVWRGIDDAEENSLVADTAELGRRIGPLAPFDLMAALSAAFAETPAPRDQT